jgi:hypothetical protein
MTPKEKAEELLHKMQLDWGCNCCYNDWAKACALIAIDEILSIKKEIWDDFHSEYFDWWNEVKQEIENL